MQEANLKKIIHDMSNSITISVGIELLNKRIHEGTTQKNQKYIDVLKQELKKLSTQMHEIQNQLDPETHL